MLTPLKDRLRSLERRDPRVDLRAYFFVLFAVREVGQALPERRHITGGELLDGVRSLALARFGLTARMVLEHWGVYTTEDIGEIVFALVDHGLLVKTENDSIKDFVGVFEFSDFENNYRWDLTPR